MGEMAIGEIKGGRMEAKEKTLGDYQFERFNLRKQIEAMDEGKDRCKSCGFLYEADLLFPYDGIFLCPRCLKKRRI